MHIHIKKIKTMAELRQAFALTEHFRILKDLEEKTQSVKKSGQAVLTALGLPPEANVRRIDLEGEEIHYVVIGRNGTERPTGSPSGELVQLPGHPTTKSSDSITTKSSKDTRSSGSARKTKK